MMPHGPDAETFEKASRAELQARRQVERHDGLHVRDPLSRSGSPRTRPQPPQLQQATTSLLAGPEEALHGPAIADEGRSAARRDPRSRRCAAGSIRPTGTDFPIQNLPFGVFARAGAASAARGGIGIGDQILDLRGLPRGPALRRAQRGVALAAAARLNRLFAARTGTSRRAAPRGHRCAAARQVPPEPVERREALLCPVGGRRAAPCPRHRRLHRLLRRHPPRDRTSASCSGPTTRCCRTTSGCRSATTAARPVVGVSGIPFRRPVGQLQGIADAPCPRSARAGGSTTSSSSALLIGPGNALGEPIPIGRAAEHVSGVLPAQRLVGARHPGLGVPAARPVPVEELRDHGLAVDRHARGAGAVPRCRVDRPGGDPPPLPYLRDERDQRTRRRWTSRSRCCSAPRTCAPAALPPHRLSASAPPGTSTGPSAQLIAHHTSGGCNLQPGDLLGTGTISAPDLGRLRQPAGDHPGWRRADRAAVGRAAHLPRRRRRDHPDARGPSGPAPPRSASASAGPP